MGDGDCGRPIFGHVMQMQPEGPAGIAQRRQPRAEHFLQWFGERDGHPRGPPSEVVSNRDGLASGRRITARLAPSGRSRRATKGLAKTVNSVLPRRIAGVVSENGHEIDVETGQRCAWIGNEMVPKWYPARNGTSARSGKYIHNLLI